MKTTSTIHGILAASAMTAAASASTINFDDLVHGQIVQNQYQASHGVTITANNPNRSHDLAIAFNSLLTGTADPDLEGPGWSGGSLDTNTMLGRMLILAENDVDANEDGLIDSPDDEGSQPAGWLNFQFNSVIDSFGLDLVDVDNLTAEGGSIEFTLEGELLATVNLSDFGGNGNELQYDGGLAWGNNSANRISPLTASGLGIASFDGVRVNLGGSGAIDNIAFTPVPAPGALACFGLAFLRGRQRRQH